MVTHLALKYIMDSPRNKKKFKTLLNIIFSNFYKIKEKTEDENENEIVDKVPFDFGGEELHSEWSNLSISSCDLKEDGHCNLSFIKPFNKLLEHIFISIALNFPLIIDGGTGKGKKIRNLLDG